LPFWRQDQQPIFLLDLFSILLLVRELFRQLHQQFELLFFMQQQLHLFFFDWLHILFEFYQFQLEQLP